MTVKVKANEELFNQWQKVGRIITNLASIVQNDMEIELDELLEWKELYRQTKSELENVYQQVGLMLRDNNPGIAQLLYNQEKERRS